MNGLDMNELTRLAAFLANFPLYALDQWEPYWNKASDSDKRYWTGQAKFLMDQRLNYVKDNPEPPRRSYVELHRSSKGQLL